ncbi:hypothetical protein RHRU231_820059 [Rhodococcus ruber]|uniref:Uncharacterized protein n=1 Tax=Rhodococcus ruber TaxID=1830 RepID=A0A098BRG8_9NOCA|nr:hypothetical protein RHRU231_820059 [Rhodococcus ruber]
MRFRVLSGRFAGGAGLDVIYWLSVVRLCSWFTPRTFLVASGCDSPHGIVLYRRVTDPSGEVSLDEWGSPALPESS